MAQQPGKRGWVAPVVILDLLRKCVPERVGLAGPEWFPRRGGLWFIGVPRREGAAAVPSLFSAARLRRHAGFRRLAGASVATFGQMLEQLRGPWEAAQRAKPRSGRPWEVGGLEDHLLVLLIHCRCYVTQEFIGFFYGVDRSVTCRAIKRVEGPVKPLSAVRHNPKVSRREAEALITGCTEQPIERPQDNATQEAHHSGKKKRHTLKTEHVVSAAGRIVSVSASHPGSRHDLTIRRAGPPLPRRARGYADSACQGYGKDRPNLDVPYKKPKGGALTQEEKDCNRGLGGTAQGSACAAGGMAVEGASVSRSSTGPGGPSASASSPSVSATRARRTMPRPQSSPGW